MKRLLSTVLALSMVFSVGTITRAEEPTADNTLTQEQKDARQKYLPIHLDLMTKLTDLRAQTKAAVENNNGLGDQIKEKAKAFSSKQNQDTIAKLKSVVEDNKKLAEQTKGLHAQRVEALKQFRDAVKARNSADANAAKDKVTSLNNQIETLRQQIKANSDSVKSQKDQLKTLRDSIKAKKAEIKPLHEQAKALGQQINTAEQAKQKLWETYKANIKAKDYTNAASTLQSIIDAKANILKDIKARGEILTNLLGVLNK